VQGMPSARSRGPRLPCGNLSKSVHRGAVEQSVRRIARLHDGAGRLRSTMKKARILSEPGLCGQSLEGARGSRHPCVSLSPWHVHCGPAEPAKARQNRLSPGAVTRARHRARHHQRSTHERTRARDGWVGSMDVLQLHAGDLSTRRGPEDAGRPMLGGL